MEIIKIIIFILILVLFVIMAILINNNQIHAFHKLSQVVVQQDNMKMLLQENAFLAIHL